MFFYLESFLLISGISGFSFFATEHIRKPGNYGKFSAHFFSRYYVYLSDFEHFPKHFVCSRQNSQGVAQSYQGTLTIEAWNWLFLVSKPKWYVDNKLIDFEQFCSNGKALTLGGFWFRKLSVDFRRFWVFIFYHRAHSKTRNLRKMLFLVFFSSEIFPKHDLLIFLLVWLSI